MQTFQRFLIQTASPLTRRCFTLTNRRLHFFTSRSDWSVKPNNLLDRNQPHQLCFRYRHKISAPSHQSSPHTVDDKAVQQARDKLPQSVLDHLKEAELLDEMERILTRFEHNCHQYLVLRYTPQMFTDLILPQSQVKLGEVANLVLQPSSGGSSNLLIDLSSRPDLVASARQAVGHFIDSVKGESASNRRSSPTANQLESAGPNAFLVSLYCVVTQDSRQRLINRGHEMLNRVKREMDKAYQSHDKLIHPITNKLKHQFSQDSLFQAREYLRLLVKHRHQLGARIWQEKEHELRNEE